MFFIFYKSSSNKSKFLTMLKYNAPKLQLNKMNREKNLKIGLIPKTLKLLSCFTFKKIGIR